MDRGIQCPTADPGDAAAEQDDSDEHRLVQRKLVVPDDQRQRHDQACEVHVQRQRACREAEAQVLGHRQPRGVKECGQQREGDPKRAEGGELHRCQTQPCWQFAKRRTGARSGPSTGRRAASLCTAKAR
jgi:hypothetical protein